MSQQRDTLARGRAGPGDHVDGVLEQWRRVRPDLDPEPLGVIARLGRVREYMDHSLDEVLRGYGLNRPLWDVLASLRRQGPPYRLSPTELYRALMRTSGAITNRLARLERAGLIERVPDADDRRGMLVGLTPRGKELVDEIAPAHLENERRLLAPLTASQQADLAKLLKRLLLDFEQESPLPPPRRRDRRAARPG
jgi:DNA-binding MarR family transcriptional regulator